MIIIYSFYFRILTANMCKVLHTQWEGRAGSDSVEDHHPSRSGSPTSLPTVPSSQSAHFTIPRTQSEHSCLGGLQHFFPLPRIIDIFLRPWTAELAPPPASNLWSKPRSYSPFPTPDLNLSPPPRALSLLSCIILFYVTYYHPRDITDLFTFCFLSPECKPQESRHLICSLLFPSASYIARHNRHLVKLNGYVPTVRVDIIKESTNTSVGPWLVWFSGLSASLWTTWSPVRSPVKAYA